jgi:hypothetical protein
MSVAKRVGAVAWHGSKVRDARSYWRPLLPLPCCRCGKPVMASPESGWHVDHFPIPREMGGKETRPAHAHCDSSAGGKRGAQITNARKQAPRMLSERERGIRGI